ncbi:hypothetical protein [Ancylobacter polymorphus]|uniref:Head decoration protein n=1 Tax=Ancylobacter polymorphus TaxID=223390 RepID=A0ABU0BHU0_9HYPH|nr:hypothetical protein [Ancylobacter polymorphus]MDQ0305346.1 hypothetical protein [Ancylobacter polymorphus]
MANNLTIKDGAGASQVLATTESAGVHTPKHEVTASALPTGAATSAKQDTIIGHVDGIESTLATLATSANQDIQNAGIKTATTSITRPADTTAYTAGDAIANSTSAPSAGGFVFSGIARASGKSGIMADLVVTSSNPAGGLSGEVYIFDSSVTAVNDNAAFAISDAEAKTLVAKIPFTLSANTNNSSAQVTNLAIGFETVGSANLYFLVRATSAYTPISGEELTFRLKALQVS